MGTRTNRRWVARVVAAAAATIFAGGLLVACGQDSQDGGASEERSLTIATTAAPPSFDPAQLDNGASAYVWGSIFDTLLTQDPTGEIVPNAAESWEYSDDALTLTLNLRKGMTFSTGDPVTADAVKSTLERDKETPGLRQAETANIESVEAPDEQTVVINLTQPTPALVSNLAMGLGAIGDPATLDEDRTALNPVGSGPYVLDESTVNGSSYVLKRRDDYWNVDAFPYSTVTVRVIEDQQALFNALQAGELDAGNVNADQVAAVEGAGFTTKQVDALAVGSLAILDREGTLVPALGDVRVRQAINMAFDRDLYMESLLGGVGSSTVQLFNPAQGAYDSELEDFYTYDPERAQDLLAEAGYANRFDLTLPSTFLSTTYEPAITQSLADIGITVTWEPVPPQEITSSLASQKYAAAWFFDGLNVPARELDNNFGVNGFLNPFHYQTPELTALIDEVALATDPAAADDIYKQINAYIVEHALTAPVVYLGTTWATKDGVTYLPEGSVMAYVRFFGTD
jgi:peptide/nickel transport system substrate-binding protein